MQPYHNFVHPCVAVVNFVQMVERIRVHLRMEAGYPPLRYCVYWPL